MLHPPAPHCDFPANVDGHPAGGLVAGAPLGVVGSRSIQCLGGRLAGIFKGNAGYRGIQANIFKIFVLDFLGVLIAIGPIDGEGCGLAPDAVAVHRQNLQGHIFFRSIPVQGGDVVRRIGSLHDQALGAIGMDLINLVRGSAGYSGPVHSDLRRVGVPVQDLIQGYVRRAVQGSPLLLCERQAAQIHLIVGDILGRLHLQANGIQDLPRQIRQIHLCGGPAAIAGGQIKSHLLAGVVGIGGLVSIVGHQLHQALVPLVGEAQLHAALHRYLGAVQHDPVGLAGGQVAIEPNGVAAVVSIGKIITTGELLALGVDDPSPGRHHVLVGLVAPLGIPGQFAIDVVALAVAGVEIGHKGSLGDDGAVCKEPGHTGPVIAGQVHRGIPGVALGIGVEHLLHLVEVLPTFGQTQGGVGAVQRQRQAGHPVFIHQQVIPEAGIHAVLLHINAREGVELAAANGLHGRNGGIHFAGSPVVVHHELVNGPGAVFGIRQELFVAVVHRILVGHTAGGQHGVVPADEHIRTLLVHIAHHLINQRTLCSGAAVGLLIEEITVKAIVIHDCNQLVGHREGAVAGLLNKLPDLLHIAGTGAPGEAQGCHHRDAIGVGRIGEFTGGTAHQALFRTGPVYKGIGILPVVKGVAQERLVPLGTGVVVISIGQGAEHQLCLRIDQGIDHKTAHPVCQGNAGPAVDCVGIRLWGPFQQGIHVEGWANGHQRFMGRISFIHLC